jgi:hypothetical protein
MGRLECLFKRECEGEPVPNDWRSVVVIALHKYGDNMNLVNYRGMTLMDVVCSLQEPWKTLDRESLRGQDSCGTVMLQE